MRKKKILRLELIDYLFEPEEYKKIKNKIVWHPMKIRMTDWSCCKNRKRFHIWHYDVFRQTIMVAPKYYIVGYPIYSFGLLTRSVYYDLLQKLAMHLARNGKLQSDIGFKLSPLSLWKNRIKNREQQR